MKISYSWLKSYIPEIPEPEKMWDIFTYHLCEVESVENTADGDTIFDINILPNRAHDLLSHQGVARELASLLDITYKDPTEYYKIPESLGRRSGTGEAKPTELKIQIDSKNCRRYSARIVRNIKVGPSPDWVVKHLESIGQRSINNVVDAANIVMYDCGQPIHAFDLDKLSGALTIREAKEGEEITTLDNKQVTLKTSNMVIADDKNVLAIAGVKGGKIAEVDDHTKNIVIEIANFDPVSVRKTARGINIFTDAAKRFENDLSPTLCDYAMRELCGLFVEYGFTDFENVVDMYPVKPEERKLSFSIDRMANMLGREVSKEEVVDVLERYNFSYEDKGDVIEITVPPMRLDLNIEEDMAEEIGRIAGYDKVVGRLPSPSVFKRTVNDRHAKIAWARNQLLLNGYNETMTYTFSNKGEVGVLQSPSDKKFLRTNLTDGLKESIKLNQLNAPFLEMTQVKVFEIGTVFKKDIEEIHVAYGDAKKINELELSEFCDLFAPKLDAEAMNMDLLVSMASRAKRVMPDKFTMWSLYPFITRDIALWVPEGTDSELVRKVIAENINELVVKGPNLFDSFTKDGKTSYAFRLVFQSYEKTLTDEEVGAVMDKITNKIKENNDWQLR